MILVRINIEDGDRTYSEYQYYENFNLEDYQQDVGKINDETILSEFFGEEFSDDDLYESHSYEYGDTVVRVGKVSTLNQEQLEVFKELRILY